MKDLKVSEVFNTVQGEGPNFGWLTTFVRFGGCNLRCPNWGSTTLPSGKVVGCCDTPYAVFPEYRDQWEKVDPDTLYRRVVEKGTTHVCITGGEPLLQNSEALASFARKLLNSGYTIDLFTNGTYELPDWATSHRVTVCMDYKMPSSGEFGKFQSENYRTLTKKDMLKLVIDPSSQEDWDEVYTVIRQCTQFGLDKPSLGVIWERSLQELIDRVIEEKLDVRVAVQAHKLIFGTEVDGESYRENQVSTTPVTIGSKSE